MKLHILASNHYGKLLLLSIARGNVRNTVDCSIFPFTLQGISQGPGSADEDECRGCHSTVAYPLPTAAAD